MFKSSAMKFLGSMVLWLITHSITVPAQSIWEWGNPLPQGHTLKSVTYGAGIFAAVGEYGTIITSPNGTFWEIRASGTVNTLRQVIHSNGLFVAVGDYGVILTSKDGITWRYSPSNTFDWLFGITFGNGNFVAVGIQGAILVSPDGYKWSNRSIGFSSEVTSVAYGNNQFLAIGDANTNFYSSDGIAWHNRDRSGGFGPTELIFAFDKFIAAMGGDIYTSSDGINWSNSSEYVSLYDIDGISQYIDGLIAIGYKGEICRSKDGSTWTRDSTGIRDDLHSIAYGNNLLVAVGNHGVIWVSEDGVTWNNIGKSQISADYSLITATYGNGKFVVVGYYSILTSPDGKNWTSRNFDFTDDTRPIGMTYGNGLFVIAGKFGTILTSSDCIKWTIRDASIDEDIYDVNYKNGSFVATGNGGGILATSKDGINWNRSTSDTIQFHHSEVFGNNIFVKIGCGQFGGPSDNSMLCTSVDGIAWNERYIGTNTFPSSIIFANNQFVIVGDSGLILTSKDGTTWNRQRSCTSYALYKIVYGGNRFIAIGNCGTIITSIANDLNVVKPRQRITNSNRFRLKYDNNFLRVKHEKGSASAPFAVEIYAPSGKRIFSARTPMVNGKIFDRNLHLVDGLYYYRISEGQSVSIGSFFAMRSSRHQ